MEKQLFDWDDGMDYVGDCVLQFYHCTLLKQVNANKPGEVIPCVVLDYENATITLQDDDGEEITTAKLEVNVV